MPLPFLFMLPQDRFGWDSFIWWNFVDHQEIQQAIQKKKNIDLPIYPMAQVEMGNFSRWSDLNAQAHTDMNQALGIAGRDLDQIDPQDMEKFREWLYDHAEEHLAARQALGI
jgi:hypothetical protein